MGSDAVAARPELEAAMGRLRDAAPATAAAPASARARLARETIATTAVVAEEWATVTAAAKGVAETPWLGEEIVVGPVAVMRHLHLLERALRDIERTGLATPPSPSRIDAMGRTRVPVVPGKGLFDGIVFRGFTAEAILAEGADVADRHPMTPPAPGVAVVLGAGNVSSIGVVDAVEQALLRGRPALLKLHPLLAPLAPVLERALGPLVRSDRIVVMNGGDDLGSAAAHHPDAALVHLTGSADTFASAVWGDDPAEAARRREEGAPLLAGDVVAELGNVTPWIVVPGEWSEKELRYQAEHLAGAIASNASFNCVCPKVVVTARDWPQREGFLEALRVALAVIPPRPAFYRGAAERFTELVGEPGGAPPATLPWTVLRDSDPDLRPELFERENFVCVTAETALPERDPARFLDAATDFANTRLGGTLAATVVVGPSQRRAKPVAEALHRAVSRLRYGLVCINQFAGIAFVMMGVPWGGYPGATLDAPGSGVGFAHNTLLLRGIETTVLEGPFRITPTPMWLPSSRNPVGIARALTRLYAAPSVRRVPRLLAAAIR